MELKKAIDLVEYHISQIFNYLSPDDKKSITEALIVIRHNEIKFSKKAI